MKHSALLRRVAKLDRRSDRRRLDSIRYAVSIVDADAALIGWQAYGAPMVPRPPALSAGEALTAAREAFPAVRWWIAVYADEPEPEPEPFASRWPQLAAIPEPEPAPAPAPAREPDLAGIGRSATPEELARMGVRPPAW